MTPIAASTYVAQPGDTYWSMLEEAAARAETAAAVETEAFGCHHGTIGGWLLQLWRLPGTLVDPVALHHDHVVANGGDVVRAVAVADRLLTATDPATGAVAEEVLARDGALAPVPLDAEAWDALYAGLAGERQAIADVFG